MTIYDVFIADVFPICCFPYDLCLRITDSVRAKVNRWIEGCVETPKYSGLAKQLQFQLKKSKSLGEQRDTREATASPRSAATAASS